MRRAHRHSTSALMCALSLASGNLVAVEQWLVDLTSSVAVLTAGPDPMPLSGAWS